jgi:hypothetical protein
VTRRTSSCRIYSTTHHNRRRRGHRERVRESTLTVIHTCHRPRIPFRHVLIELRCAYKHCQRGGCNKEKKHQTHKWKQKEQKRVRDLWPDKPRVVVDTHHKTEGAVATEREREYTYCMTYLSPPPYSISTRPDWTFLPHKTLQEERRVQQRKERPNPSHTTNNNNKVPFQTTTKNKNNTCVRLVPRRRTSSCRIYSTTHHNGRRRDHREGERESTLTLYHICHRPCIPGGHVLIERKCFIKHCKKREKGATKNRKTKPTTQTIKRSRFKPQPPKKQNEWDLWPDEPEMSYI